MSRTSTPEELARRFPNGPARGVTGYQIQYYAAWITVVTLALTGAIQLAGPTDLGLSPVAFRWIGIVASTLGVIQGFLPSLRRPPVARDDSGPSSSPDPQPRDGS